MAAQVDAESLGTCTSMGESTGACPKHLPLEVIAITNPLICEQAGRDAWIWKRLSRRSYHDRTSAFYSRPQTSQQDLTDFEE